MNKKILIAIILLAAFLRFYRLGSFPVSLSWDEVAIGYNAYSISQTGADEYGIKWPILFKSFNDYKLPGYIYLDSIVIKFLNLSELSVRLPSAIFGIMAVFFIYLLVKKLFENFRLNFSLAHISALILAISPWHLQMSRAAFEANGALTFILAGVVFLLYGLKNKVLAFLSIPIIALAIYFYYSPRIFVPLILVIFAFLYKKEIIANLKFYLVGLILAIFLLIPISTKIFSTEGLKRVNEVSIFADKSLITDYVDAKAKENSFLSKVFLNRRVPIIFEGFHNYFSHFSPGFLFFGDDPNPRHKSAFHGNLYIFEIPLIMLGVWVLLRQKDQKTKYFLVAWLLLAPLPAALTQETPHGLRSLLMLPPLVILSSIGIIHLIKSPFSRIVFTGVLIIFFINYLYSYYSVYPLRNNLAWAYGYKQMLSEISKIENGYDRIIITGHYWKPYIFYLFYNRIDPKIYQLIQDQQAIGKIRFGTTGWDMGGQDLTQEESDKFKGNKTLLVVTPAELETFDDKDNFKKISMISDYSGKNEVFLIGEWR